MNPYDAPQPEPIQAAIKPASAWKRALVLAVPFFAGAMAMDALLSAIRGERVFPALFAVGSAVMLAVAWRMVR